MTCRTDVLPRWHAEHRWRRSGPLWEALALELWWCEIGSAPPAGLGEAGRPPAALW